jgi:GT2 family glycosyltransferase
MWPTLPAPPGVDDLLAACPVIPQVPAGEQRPFWSVMIPTYNCAGYLRRTLRSVLVQDPGAEEMQVEVVDDCSTKDDPEAVVRELGHGRVHFYRNPANQGATQTFNTCIERARGHWVHILHGDDMVLPGFYSAYRGLIAGNAGLSLVTGRVVRIDEHDRWLSVGGLMPPPDNPLVPDFLARQAVKNHVSFPSAVVARSTYETIGGFSTYFSHVADMDMWFRAGQVGQVAASCRALSCYRIHSGSDTSRLMVSATNIRETYVLALLNLQRLRSSGLQIDDSWLAALAGFAEGTAWQMDESGNQEGALNQARWAWALQPTYRRFKLLIKTGMKAMFRSGGPAGKRHSRRTSPGRLLNPAIHGRPTRGVNV